MNLILCGPPMCGKSYYGKRVAEYLQWSFIDTDLLIEECIHKQIDPQLTCCEYFRRHGEKAFRQLESEVIASLKGMVNVVISVGGGSLICRENITILKELGHVVFLRTEIETLLSRLKFKNPLPAYVDDNNPEGSFLKVVEKRNAICATHADIIVDLKEHSEEKMISLISTFTCGGLRGQ